MKDYSMLNVKLYGDENEKLSRLYEAAGTDKSAFVRACIFSDKVIIYLLETIRDYGLDTFCYLAKNPKKSKVLTNYIERI